jgi:hypothetical protein
MTYHYQALHACSLQPMHDFHNAKLAWCKLKGKNSPKKLDQFIWPWESRQWRGADDPEDDQSHAACGIRWRYFWPASHVVHALFQPCVAVRLAVPRGCPRQHREERRRWGRWERNRGVVIWVNLGSGLSFLLRMGLEPTWHCRCWNGILDRLQYTDISWIDQSTRLDE